MVLGGATIKRRRRCRIGSGRRVIILSKCLGILNNVLQTCLSCESITEIKCAGSSLVFVLGRLKVVAFVNIPHNIQ